MKVNLQGILNLAADTREQLRPSDVDRVMSEAHDLGVLGEFKDWVLAATFNNPRTKTTIEMWKALEEALRYENRNERDRHRN